MPVGPVQRRAVHPPGCRSTSPARCRRRRRSRRSSPTRTRTSATSWSTRCWRRRSTATTSPTSGPTSCASSGAASRTGPTGTFAFHDWIREAIATDKPYDQFVREILARHRRRDQEPADGLVQGAAEPRAVRGRHRPGLPRPAHGLCPVPPPPVREVEPGRLLGPGRVLRPRRPQERAGARRRRQNQQTSRQVDLQPADRQRHQQADQPAGRR